MTLASALYRLLRVRNDATAVSRTLSTGSPRPVAMRVARKAVGRSAGRIMRGLR